jgi:hypothetical protein
VTLTELAIKYSSDRYYSHSYIGFYEELFRGRTVRRLLEIGLGYESLMVPFLPPDVAYVHGSGVKMWADFFPDAEIFACDIREDTLINEGRIRSMVCDQSDPVSLRNMADSFGGPFDFICDDGSHEPLDQMLSAFVLLPYLTDGWIYVIEDCREPERVAEAVGGEIHRFNKRPDDVLVVIRK